MFKKKKDRHISHDRWVTVVGGQLVRYDQRGIKLFDENHSVLKHVRPNFAQNHTDIY